MGGAHHEEAHALVAELGPGPQHHLVVAGAPVLGNLEGRRVGPGAALAGGIVGQVVGDEVDGGAPHDLGSGPHAHHAQLGGHRRTGGSQAHGLTGALARMHARSGDRLAMAAYLGSGRAFDRAIARFSAAYADQNELDHARLAEAVAAGELPARHGV